VSTLITIVVGTLLLAHGLVHLLYLSSDAGDASYPFTLEDSLLPEAVRRPIAYPLLGTTVAAFALLALALWGVPGLAGLWAPLAIAAAAVSLALLVVFWDPRLLAGVAIDLAVVAIAFTQPKWIDRIAT
jgi:hypothetical protein